MGCSLLLGAATTFLSTPPHSAPAPRGAPQFLQAYDDEPPSTGGFSGVAAVAVAGLVAAGAAAMSRRARNSKLSVAAVGDTWDIYPPCEDGPIKYPQYLKEPLPPPGNWTAEYVKPEATSHAQFPLMVGGNNAEINDGEPWDPMGWHKLFDRNFEFNRLMVYPHIQWMREAELKHGRVCMLAFVGFIVQQWVQIPGYPQQPDWEKALWECYADPLAKLGLVQISIFAFIYEGYFFPLYAWIGKMSREPGDMGFDPLKFSKKPGFDIRQKQLVELKNGRLAMVGVASIFANHAIPGSVPLLTGAY